MSEDVTPRGKSLLEHFSAIGDDRQPCKVMYPLSEVLLYDDIVL